MKHIPEGNYYTKEHEWVFVDETVVRMGITTHAQESLGEVIYIELPEEGQKVNRGDSLGVVESVKAVSDLYAPVSGTVLEVNHKAVQKVGIVSDSPMDEGWLLTIEIDNEKELAYLLKPEDYRVFLEKEQK